MDVLSKRFYMLGFAALFWISTILGLWAAYDASSARTRFVLLTFGTLVVIATGLLSRQQRQQAAPVFAILVAIIASAIAGYYLIFQQNQHDALSGIVGSALAILLPINLGAVQWATATKKTFWLILCAAMALLGLAALAMTGERTAWLSLAIGLMVAGLFWLGQQSKSLAKQLPILSMLIWFFAALGIAVYILFLRNDAFSQWLISIAHLNPDSDLFGRRELWNNAVALLEDYPFTGSGLAATKMALATYVYINHVAGQPHVHNIYLQAGSEQGWLGLLGWLGMVVMAVALGLEASQSSKGELQGIRTATLASSIALAIYGLLDAEIYAYMTVPLAFVPLAFAMLVRRSALVHHHSHHRKTVVVQEENRQAFGQIALSTIALAAIVGLVWLNGNLLRSALFVNLATVAQTKAELGVYQWPEWGIQDQLRQSEGGVALSQAERFFRIGLVFNPRNETALRRTGQIALARGDYEKAEEQLRAALQIAPDHRATRQMLGELLAIRGKVEEAVSFWQSLSFLDGQLDGRIWWYEQLDRQQAADNIRTVQSKIQ